MLQSHTHFQGSLPQLCQHVPQAVHLVFVILVLHLDMLLVQSVLSATHVLHLGKEELPRRTDGLWSRETPSIAGSRSWWRHLILAASESLHHFLELLLVVELDVFAVPVHAELGAGGLALASQDGGGRYRVQVGWQGVSHRVWHGPRHSLSHKVGHSPWHGLELLRERCVTTGSGEGWGGGLGHGVLGVSTTHGVRGVGTSNLLGGKVPCGIFPPL